MSLIKKSLLLWLILFFLIKTNNGKPCPSGGDLPAKCQKIILSQQPCDHVPLWVLNVITLLTAFLILILLGILKGLIGLLCCIPIGMWGLGTLIDLPQPLNRYQEAKLKNIPVVYDHIGWPVHPVNGKRSVRALTKRTEFCLNTIFFLTYPLAMLITICSSCCFQESTNAETFQCVNSITFDYSQPRRKNALKMTKARTIVKSGEYSSKRPIYSDEGSDEERDAEYAQQQKKRSKQSLKSGVVH